MIEVWKSFLARPKAMKQMLIHAFPLMFNTLDTLFLI